MDAFRNLQNLFWGSVKKRFFFSVLVFHGVKHGHSYRSQDYTVHVIRTIFESSSFAKSMSCGKTKARAIRFNVLSPYFTTTIIDDLLKARFYSISVDASNKASCKTPPPPKYE